MQCSKEENNKSCTQQGNTFHRNEGHKSQILLFLLKNNNNIWGLNLSLPKWILDCWCWFCLGFIWKRNSGPELFDCEERFHMKMHEKSEFKQEIKAFETKRLRKLLCTSYLQHKTNDWVWSKINFLVGPQEPLLATVKRWKLAWFGHVTCHDSLSKTIRHGSLKSGRCHGRQRKYWVDNIKEWTSLSMPEPLTMASCRKDWKRISGESSVMSFGWLIWLDPTEPIQRW